MRHDIGEAYVSVTDGGLLTLGRGHHDGLRLESNEMEVSRRRRGVMVDEANDEAEMRA